jgi:hypothetical protein
LMIREMTSSPKLVGRALYRMKIQDPDNLI